MLGPGGAVEVEVDEDVGRVVDGLSDGVGADAGPAAHVGEAVEGGVPGAEVRDRVLDVECEHATSIVLAGRVSHPRSLGLFRAGSYARSMVGHASAERVRGAILQHCRSGLGGRALRSAVIEELRRAVAFEGYVWVLTDPVTCVGVDPLADVPGVTDLARTIRLKYATPINRWTTLAGVAGLGDLAATSPLWREVQQPLGVVDVASAVFRDVHGCWGFLDLWLWELPRPDHLALLTSVLAEVTRALRSAQADTLRLHPSGTLEYPGAATLLLDADLRIQGSTPGMEDRLQRLLPAPEGLAPVPAAALNVAAQLMAVEEGVDGHDPEARTHLGDGRWVVVRAARLRPSDAISVSVEPTTPAERLALCVRAFGLTAREADIVGRVARGLDTASIARELQLAPYTIQDHLKSIFTKTGVDSRRDLVPLLSG